MFYLLEATTFWGKFLEKIPEMTFEIVITSFLVERLIKWQEDKRLRPIRKEFINFVSSAIDKERLILDLAFLYSNMNLLINSFEITNVGAKMQAITDKLELAKRKLDFIMGKGDAPVASDLPAHPATQFSEQETTTRDQIFDSLNAIRRLLEKAITQIDASQSIFTIKMSGILIELRQKLAKDVDCINSLSTFIKNPSFQLYINREAGPILSINDYKSDLPKLWRSVKQENKKIEWLDKIENTTLIGQTALIEKLYKVLANVD